MELDKTNETPSSKLGELYLLGNETDESARGQADIVLVSAPQNMEVRDLKGRQSDQSKSLCRCNRGAKKGPRLDPRHAQNIELARASVLSRIPDAAQAALKQALMIDPRSVYILVALGDFRVTTAKPDHSGTDNSSLDRLLTTKTGPGVPPALINATVMVYR